jgi:hypothetical protein
VTGIILDLLRSQISRGSLSLIEHITAGELPTSLSIRTVTSALPTSFAPAMATGLELTKEDRDDRHKQTSASGTATKTISLVWKTEQILHLSILL